MSLAIFRNIRLLSPPALPHLIAAPLLAIHHSVESFNPNFAPNVDNAVFYETDSILELEDLSSVFDDHAASASASAATANAKRNATWVLWVMVPVFIIAIIGLLSCVAWLILGHSKHRIAYYSPVSLILHPSVSSKYKWSAFYQRRLLDLEVYWTGLSNNLVRPSSTIEKVSTW